MCRTTGKVEALDVAAAVRRLEGAIEVAVAGDAVDCAVQHAVAVVNVCWRERGFKDDAVFDVREASSTFQLVEDDLTVAGEHL